MDFMYVNRHYNCKSIDYVVHFLYDLFHRTNDVISSCCDYDGRPYNLDFLIFYASSYLSADTTTHVKKWIVSLPRTNWLFVGIVGDSCIVANECGTRRTGCGRWISNALSQAVALLRQNMTSIRLVRVSLSVYNCCGMAGSWQWW